MSRVLSFKSLCNKAIVIALYLLSNVKFGYRLNLMCLLSSLMIGVVLSNYIASFESLISKIPLFGSSISFYLYSEKFGVQVFTVGALLKKKYLTVV